MCTILEGSSLCRRNSPRTDTHMLTPTQNSTVSLYYIGLFYIGGTTMAALFFCPHYIVFAAPRLQVHSTLSSIIAATEFFVRHLIFLPSFLRSDLPRLCPNTLRTHCAHTYLSANLCIYDGVSIPLKLMLFLKVALPTSSQKRAP